MSWSPAASLRSTGPLAGSLGLRTTGPQVGQPRPQPPPPLSPVPSPPCWSSEEKKHPEWLVSNQHQGDQTWTDSCPHRVPLVPISSCAVASLSCLHSHIRAPGTATPTPFRARGAQGLLSDADGCSVSANRSPRPYSQARAGEQGEHKARARPAPGCRASRAHPARRTPITPALEGPEAGARAQSRPAGPQGLGLWVHNSSASKRGRAGPDLPAGRYQELPYPQAAAVGPCLSDGTVTWSPMETCPQGSFPG